LHRIPSLSEGHRLPQDSPRLAPTKTE
jgi:hypothetical protein